MPEDTEYTEFDWFEHDKPHALYELGDEFDDSCHYGYGWDNV